MKRKVFIDYETFCEKDIDCGAYAYAFDPSCKVLLVGYMFEGDTQVRVTENIHDLQYIFTDESYEIWAHNAPFEHLITNLYYEVPKERFKCTMTLGAKCGLPLPLANMAGVLGVTKKLESGTSLINFFCTTKSGLHFMEDYPEKKQQFIEYLINDVKACKDIHDVLECYIDWFDWERYYADWRMNERGVQVDIDLAEGAKNMCDEGTAIALAEIKQITGLQNPNSRNQVLEWLAENGLKLVNLRKEQLPELIQNTTGDVKRVLELRLLSSNKSVTKFDALLRSHVNGRCYGMIQHNGATRTGRAAGRILQVQNLKRIDIPDLDYARQLTYDRNIDALDLWFGDPLNVISQLIRTALLPTPGNKLAVADFSAIEARVTAWLAGCKWRLDVFRTHGKIYEASAAAILNKRIEDVTKQERQQIGKVAELALGFGGWIGAFRQFLTVYNLNDMFTDEQIKQIVLAWRAASPEIPEMWFDFEDCAKAAIATGSPQMAECGIEFGMTEDKLFMYIKLLSGRRLMYYKPQLTRDGIIYVTVTSQKEKIIKGYGHGCSYVKTYGGKLTENIVQATALDLLQDCIQVLDGEGMPLVMQVHDELVADTPTPQDDYDRMVEVMSAPISEWAQGLPLGADGYISDYYKK